VSEDHLSQVGLPGLGPLEALAEDDRRMLASYGGFRYLHAGDVVIGEGARQESLFLVLSGTLHATRRLGDHEVLVGEIHTGECFGEVTIFDAGAASATVTAAGPSQLWSLGALELRDYVTAYPEAGVTLLTGIAAILARRLRSVSQKLVSKVEYQELLAEIEKGSEPV
jgi:CRP-like cAMP-binding protein